ncbi:MAG: hypothetical protein ACI3ZL_03935 [Candidatus Cryptobacteroides sp.]
MKPSDEVMRGFTRTMPALLLLSALCAGCFVKEDRSDCPCRLVLDFSQVDVSVVDSASVVALAGGDVVLMETVHSDSFGKEYIASLPREDEVFLAVLSCLEGFSEGDDAMIIPYGMDCPPVYMFTAVIDSKCEYLRKTVALRKNFCRLKVHVQNGEEFPFRLVVRGDVDGYKTDGRPSEGDFRCSASEIDDGVFTVVLPRQTDSSLELDVDDGTDVLKTFALGEILAASGYDWTAPDLPDVTLGIDYARTELSVSIQGWDKVYSFDFVI